VAADNRNKGKKNAHLLLIISWGLVTRAKGWISLLCTLFY
jgi:hypothetical protein